MLAILKLAVDGFHLPATPPAVIAPTRVTGANPCAAPARVTSAKPRAAPVMWTDIMQSAADGTCYLIDNSHTILQSTLVTGVAVNSRRWYLCSQPALGAPDSTSDLVPQWMLPWCRVPEAVGRCAAS